MDYKTSSPDRYLLLKEYARKNRKFPTMAESVLWQRLRNRQLEAKFVRQHVVGDYIVDFMTYGSELVIEVDGAYHSEPRQKEDDQIREDVLTSMGLKVVRFTNEEVLC